MNYGKLGSSSDPGGPSLTDHSELSTSRSDTSRSSSSSRRKKLILLSLLSFTLLAASAVSATLLLRVRTRASGPSGSVSRKPTQAISRTCGKTLYPSLCVKYLLDFPGSKTATENDLVHISFNMTLQHFSRALYLSSAISYLNMGPLERSAYEDCVELLEDSVDGISRSLSGGSNQDVMTWLSAALTNQDTCNEGFEDLNGGVKDQMAAKLKDLSELVSNCLAIFSASGVDDFSGVPIQNKRRLMTTSMEAGISEEDNNVSVFPSWLGRRERSLLSLPVSAIQADIIVSNDGNGTYKTIAEAIKKAPEYSTRRTIIYVRAGR